MCGPDAFELASRLVDRSLLVADTAGRVGPVRHARVAAGLRPATDSPRPASWRTARADHLRWCIELAERVDRGGPPARPAGVAEPPRRRARQRPRRARLRRRARSGRRACELIGGADPAVVVPRPPPGDAATGSRRASPPAPTSRRCCGPACSRRAGCSPSRPAASVRRSAPATSSTTSWRSPRLASARPLAICLADDDELRHRAGAAAAARHAGPAGVGRRADRPRRGGRARRRRRDARSTVSATTSGRPSSASPTPSWPSSHGELDRARGRRRRRRPFARRSGDRFSASRIEYVLGMVDDLRGDARGAYRHIEHSLRLLDELGIHQAVTAQARLLAPARRTLRRAGAGRAVAGVRQRSRRRLDPLRRHGDGAARNHEGLDGPGRRRPRAGAATPTTARSTGTPRPASRPASRSRESCLGFLAAEVGDDAGAARHHAAALGGGDDGRRPRRRWRWPSRVAAAASRRPGRRRRAARRRERLRSPSSAAPTHRTTWPDRGRRPPLPRRRGVRRRPRRRRGPRPPRCARARPPRDAPPPRLTRLVQFVK